MNQDLLRVLSEMVKSPVNQYVLPGLTSSLVGGEGWGCVRMLTSDRDTREWVTPHSHRFDFSCLVLDGSVENILFRPGDKEDSNLYAVGTLAPIEGGLGKYDVIHGTKPEPFFEERSIYGSGQIYSMRAHEIHSIRFSKGAKVLLFEAPDVNETSLLLEPYSNGQTIHTFETQLWMFKK